MIENQYIVSFNNPYEKISKGLTVRTNQTKYKQVLKSRVNYHQLRNKRKAKEFINRYAKRGLKVLHIYQTSGDLLCDIPDDLIQEVFNDPDVQHINPNRVVEILAQVPDWGISNIQADVAHTAGVKGAGVKVAVIDTGIDIDHEDLAANYAGGWNFGEGTSNPNDTLVGHGSHCAGIIGAVDNTVGVLGVAPSVSIYALKCTDSFGIIGVAAVLSSLQWCLTNAMDVVSISLAMDEVPSIATAITDLYNADITVVAAAGNASHDFVVFSCQAVAANPASQTDTHVKATTKYDTHYWPYYATDPSRSYTGNWYENGWVSADLTTTNQRLHIDLGSAKVVNRFTYINGHDNGTQYFTGVKNFTLWGSNNAADFADLTYANDGTWTQLSTQNSWLDKETYLLEYKEQLVFNTTAYRYYAFKFADTWRVASDLWSYYMSIRRIELRADTYTDRTSTITDETANNVTLPPMQTSVLGDALYIGAYNVAGEYNGRMKKIRVQLPTAKISTGGTLTWQNYAGALTSEGTKYSWYTSSITPLSDGTNSFGTAGTNDIVFRGLNWTQDQCTINGVTAYFYRAVMTSLPTTVTLTPVALALWISTMKYPASYETVIAVGAIDSANAVSYFSSRGFGDSPWGNTDYVDVVAPGSSVRSCYLNNQYAYMSGTSMACPYVAGLVALYRGAHPDKTVDEIRQWLRDNAVDMEFTGRDSLTGFGRVKWPNASITRVFSVVII